jgi:hypothetical protein
MASTARFSYPNLGLRSWPARNLRGGSLVADRGWKRPFDGPIPLPGGRQLTTLKDAAAYITKLPKANFPRPALRRNDRYDNMVPKVSFGTVFDPQTYDLSFDF